MKEHLFLFYFKLNDSGQTNKIVSLRFFCWNKGQQLSYIWRGSGSGVLTWEKTLCGGMQKAQLTQAQMCVCASVFGESPWWSNYLQAQLLNSKVDGVLSEFCILLIKSLFFLRIELVGVDQMQTQSFLIHLSPNLSFCRNLSERYALTTRQDKGQGLIL